MKHYAQIAIKGMSKKDFKESLLEVGLKDNFFSTKFTSEGISVKLKRSFACFGVAGAWGIDVFSDKVEDSAKIYNSIRKKCKSYSGLFIFESIDKDLGNYLNLFEGEKQC